VHGKNWVLRVLHHYLSVKTPLIGPDENAPLLTNGVASTDATYVGSSTLPV